MGATATHGAQQLLMTLADGDWHSGELLAQRLAVTRMTVSNYAKQLVAAGFPIESKSRSGYRLSNYPEVLNDSDLSAQSVLPVVVAASINSTNDLALEWLKASAAPAAIFVAEHQAAGRGRRGRVWQAVPGAALLYSLAWRFERFPPDLPALSLLVASVLANTLLELGVNSGLGIKWPNDVLLNNKKLAGVLVEAVIRDEQVAVVIGIGLNILQSPQADTRYPATSLREEGYELTRSELLLAVTKNLQAALQKFVDHGFKAFHADYMRYDKVVGMELALDGRQLSIKAIDESGALVAESANGAGSGEVKRYVSGELSLPWPSC